MAASQLPPTYREQLACATCWYLLAVDIRGGCDTAWACRFGSEPPGELGPREVWAEARFVSPHGICVQYEPVAPPVGSGEGSTGGAGNG